MNLKNEIKKSVSFRQNFNNILGASFSYQIMAPKITKLREALSYKKRAC